MELPFKSEELKLAWEEWLLERKDRKLKKYTDRGMKAAISHLLELANRDEMIAVQIINQSIAQGWQGLFELKNKQNGFNQSSKLGTSAARVEALKKW